PAGRLAFGVQGRAPGADLAGLQVVARLVPAADDAQVLGERAAGRHDRRVLGPRRRAVEDRQAQMRAGVVERDIAARPAIDDDVALLEIEDAALAHGKLVLGKGAQPVAAAEALALVPRPLVERPLDLGLEAADLV